MANEILIQLKATYVGAAGKALVAYLEQQKAIELQQLLNVTDHTLMVQHQQAVKVYDKLLKLKDTVRKL